MKIRTLKVAFMAIIAMLLPTFSFAGTSDSIHSLQGVLDNLYDQMMPMCSQLINIGRGIAGFAAMWYIAVKVWRHIASAEPVDFYPLLRPFAIGFCIISFPAVLSLINGVLKPTVDATHAMVGDSNQAIAKMLTPDNTQTAPVTTPQTDPNRYYQYTHPDSPTGPAVTTNPLTPQYNGWSVRNWIREQIAEFLNVCFEAAALCIDTIRTFKLIVLAILGPLCFGLSVFDGFQHTLKQWLARYINVYMWLPVANIFGAIIAKIQENLIAIEQAGGSADPHFRDTNTAYLVFLLLGIVGYFTVPSIANYIINVGGHALFSKTAALASSVTAFSTGRIVQGISDIKQLFKDNKSASNSGGNTGSSSGSGGAGSYMADKLSGRNTT